MFDSIKKNKILLILIAATLLVRIIYLIELSDQPDAQVPMVDEKFFYQQAEQISNGTLEGPEAYFRAPLYGYFLAILYLITSGSIFWMKLLQILLCAVTVTYIFKLSELIFNRTVGIIAGAIYALYGTLLFYESMFLIPVLFLPLLLISLYRLTKQYLENDKSIISWIITGLFFGLAAIARPNILLVVPFLMLFLFIKEKDNFTAKIKKPLLLFLGLLIAIVPVTIRNYSISDEFILISSQGGINLYLGNNPESDGLTMLMPELKLNEELGWDDFEKATIQTAEKESGKSLTPNEASSFWTSKALSFISKNPGQFISLLYKKTVYLLSGFENSDNKDLYFSRKDSTVYSLLLWNKLIYFPFGLLLPLALAGFVITLKEKRKLSVIYIFLLAYIPSIVLFLVTARHRLPLIPFLIILASAGLYTVVKKLSTVNRNKLLISALVFTVSIIVFNNRYFEQSDLGSNFQSYLNQGIVFEQVGEFDKAESEYLKALSIFKGSKTLYNNLGHVQYRLGKLNEAEINYLKAINIDPDFSMAYNNLALVYNEMNYPDSALKVFRLALKAEEKNSGIEPISSTIYSNIADIFAKKGIPDSAIFYFEKSIGSEQPDNKAILQAASYMAQMKMFTKSDSLFYVLEENNALDKNGYFNWGLSYLNRGDFVTAKSKMFEVLKSDNSFYPAYHVIAASYFETGASTDSVKFYLDQALRLKPDYGPSLNLQKIISEQ